MMSYHPVLGFPKFFTHIQVNMVCCLEKYQMKAKVIIQLHNVHSHIAVRPLHRDDSTESARAVLLRDVEPIDYYVGGSTASTNTASTNGSDHFYGPNSSSNRYYTHPEISEGTGLDAMLSPESAHNHGSAVLYQGGTMADSFIPDTTGGMFGGLPVSRNRVGPPPRGLFDDV